MRAIRRPAKKYQEIQVHKLMALTHWQEFSRVLKTTTEGQQFINWQTVNQILWKSIFDWVNAYLKMHFFQLIQSHMDYLQSVPLSVSKDSFWINFAYSSFHPILRFHSTIVCFQDISAFLQYHPIQFSIPSVLIRSQTRRKLAKTWRTSKLFRFSLSCTNASWSLRQSLNNKR